jgi:exosortase B
MRMAAGTTSREPMTVSRKTQPSWGGGSSGQLAVWGPWALVTFGLVALFAHTFFDLINGLWRTDQNSHGPIVFAVAIWFFIHKARELSADPSLAFRPAPLPGWLLVGFGALVYVVGRTQTLYLLEVGALIPILAGVVLIFFGVQTLKRLWFAFFFLLFMVPLPGSLTDAITQPMKLAVSWAAEHLLYFLGQSVSRSGVVLNVGQYQLLVADACAGLNSLFTLEALGLLYMNVVRHSSVVRNLMLAILIVPISFAANVIRVLVLAMVTLHFGDAAGQGFVHDFSGFVLFITALLLVIGVDGLLRTGVHLGRATRRRLA